MAIHIYKINGHRVDRQTYEAAIKKDNERKYMYPYAIKYFEKHGYPVGVYKNSPIEAIIREFKNNTKAYRTYVVKDRLGYIGCLLLFIVAFVFICCIPVLLMLLGKFLGSIGQ